MPDMIMFVTIAVCTRPPRQRPTSDSANCTNRSVIFACSMISPSSRKSRIDKIRKESTPANIRVTITSKLIRGKHSSAPAADRPTAKPTGTFMASSKNSRPNNTNVTVIALTPQGPIRR